MNVSEIVELADRIGLIVFMLAAFVGLIKGLWVPGWVYTDLVQDRDKWRDMAIRGTQLAEKSIDRTEE